MRLLYTNVRRSPLVKVSSLLIYYQSTSCTGTVHSFKLSNSSGYYPWISYLLVLNWLCLQHSLIEPIVSSGLQPALCVSFDGTVQITIDLGKTGLVPLHKQYVILTVKVCTIVSLPGSRAIIVWHSSMQGCSMVPQCQLVTKDWRLISAQILGVGLHVNWYTNVFFFDVKWRLCVNCLIWRGC